MPSKRSLRASLGSIVVIIAASGCGGQSTETGAKATPSERHASQNREMEDFMKNQTGVSSQAK